MLLLSQHTSLFRAAGSWNFNKYHICFELQDPEILTYNTENIFGENLDPKTVYIYFLEHELREATGMRFYWGVHRRIARSDAR